MCSCSVGWLFVADTNVTLAFVDAQVIAPFFQEETDNTDNTNNTDDTDDTDNTDDTYDTDDTDDIGICWNRLD